MIVGRVSEETNVRRCRGSHLVPVPDYDYKMILAGAGCVAAMSTYGAYRAKWTNVFKASYASTCGSPSDPRL